jgi:transposase
VIDASLPSPSEPKGRLTKIPGVGPIGAVLLTMKTPEPELFRSGRQFAAWIRLDRIACRPSGPDPTNTWELRRLLRACCERPRARRAAEHKDEPTPRHSITSSAIVVTCFAGRPSHSTLSAGTRFLVRSRVRSR